MQKSRIPKPQSLFKSEYIHKFDRIIAYPVHWLYSNLLFREHNRNLAKPIERTTFVYSYRGLNNISGKPYNF